MNLKLAFQPVSQTPVDLLVVILDPEHPLHVIDDPGIAARVASAQEAFSAKTRKREYFGTLPEGSPAKALLVYWNPTLKNWNLWENVKTFTARALRVARDERFVRIGIVLNSPEAAAYVGKVV